jgi:hypothetical protein
MTTGIKENAESVRNRLRNSKPLSLGISKSLTIRSIEEFCHNNSGSWGIVLFFDEGVDSESFDCKSRAKTFTQERYLGKDAKG